MYNMPIFKTVRETARTGLISENQLRILVRSGRCPGIYRGSRFMVNVTALGEQLDEESRAKVIRKGR